MHKFFLVIIILVSCSLHAQGQKKEKESRDSILSPCVSELYVPNSFSGNGDSVNDTFLPRLVGEPATYEFIIYNRWGEVIFNTGNVNEGWNGRYKDQAQPMDVYVWTIKFTCSESEKKYSFTGHVSLIR